MAQQAACDPATGMRTGERTMSEAVFLQCVCVGWKLLSTAFSRRKVVSKLLDN